MAKKKKSLKEDKKNSMDRVQEENIDKTPKEVSKVKQINKSDNLKKEIEESNEDDGVDSSDRSNDHDSPGFSRRSLTDIFPGLDERSFVNLERVFVERKEGDDENANQGIYDSVKTGDESGKNYNLNNDYELDKGHYNGSGMQQRTINSMRGDFSSESMSGQFRRTTDSSSEWGMGSLNNQNQGNNFEQKRDYETHREKDSKKRRDKLI